MPDSAHSPTIPSSIKDFLEDALPMNSSQHTLALGECHDKHDHIQWLTEHLGELKQRGVTTIGLEQSSFFNVFYGPIRMARLNELLAAKRPLETIFRRCL